MSSSFARALLALGLFLVVNISQAGPIGTSLTATLGEPTNNPGLGGNNLSININDGTSASSFTTYNYAGFLNWSQSPAGNNAFVPQNFSTFCIEISQNVGIGGTYTYLVADLANAPNTNNNPSAQMGAAAAQAIGVLWAQYYPTLDNNNNPQASLVQAAAFQLAIWRIEYDWNDGLSKTDFTNLSLSTANFQANGNSSVTTAASSMLGFVYDNDATAPVATGLIALTNASYQDQITLDPPLAATPEPSSLCLGIIGSLVLTTFGYGRRRQPGNLNHA